MSRRSWAALVATAAPALAHGVVQPLPQAASAPPPQGAPQPPPPPATPEARMQKAVADIRKTSDRLAQIEVPMDIEPAFSFRAVYG
jgi:hypothetical protein